MKRLIPILFLLLVVKTNAQQVNIQMHDTSMSTTVANLPITSCVVNCIPVTYQWKNVSGNPVTFALTNSSKTIISNFQPGVTRIALLATTTTAKVYSDTLTITFTSPNQPCDSAGIIAAYLKAHPCPTPVCPPPIPQRTATGINIGTGGKITITYSDGTTSTL